MATQPYETERKHLLQCVPKLVKGNGTPNKSLSEITIRFEGTQLAFERLQRCLEYYCWPTNTTKAGSVKDPAIDGDATRGKLDGIWRFVSCDGSKAGRADGIYLTLREGYAQELKWDEARVPSRAILPHSDATALEGTNTDEDYIDVLFPNCDPTKSQTMAEGLRTLGTVDAPRIWTHAYTGSYHVIYARAREEEDGSHSVVGLLARPRSYLKTYENYASHDASDVYYLHHVPKTIVQSVVDNPVYKTTGASCTANYATDRGTYDLIIRTGPDEPVTITNKQTEDGCLTEVFTDFYFGITKAAMLAVSVGSSPQGWLYQINNISPAANGKFNMIVERTHAIARTATEYTGEINPTAETKVQEYKNQPTIPSIGAAVQGLIKRVSAFLNRFCVYDATKTTIESTPWEVEFSVEAEEGTEYHTVKGNQDTIDFGEPGDGYYHRLAGWSRNEDGTYNWHIIKIADDFDSEVTQHWYFRTARHTTLYIASGTYTGYYQDRKRVYRWKFESKHFKTEADGYAWLRESDFFSESSYVHRLEQGKYTAIRISLDADYGWQDDGNPYQAL